MNIQAEIPDLAVAKLQEFTILHTWATEGSPEEIRAPFTNREMSYEDKCVLMKVRAAEHMIQPLSQDSPTANEVINL